MRQLQRLLVACALSGTMVLVGCGDDDPVVGTDAGATDGGNTPVDGGVMVDGGMVMTDGGTPDRDSGTPDMDGGTDVDGGTPDVDGGTPDVDAGMDVDGGTPGMDAGMPGMDAGTPGMDAGTPGMDAGPMVDVNMQIQAVRDAADGMHDPALPINGATVTYIKAEVGDDPAGFFVQGDMTGPALYVAVGTLPADITVGDTVSFNVTETATVNDQPRALSISDFSRMATGTDVSTLAQDLSMAADVVTNLDDYGSELVSFSGEITGDFSFAGAGHVAAVVETDGVMGESNLRFRIPETLRDEINAFSGCLVEVTETPMWRFRGVAQFSAYDASEVTLACEIGVTGASVGNANEVRVLFNSPVDAATVDVADFAIDMGVTVSAAAVDAMNPAMVVLTTTDLSFGVDYTVTVSDLEGVGGHSLDGTMNTAMFSFELPSGGSLIFSEYIEGSGTDNKALEITNLGTETVDLTTCEVQFYFNGSDSSSAQINFMEMGWAAGATMLAPNASVVMCRGDISPECDITGLGALNFNGDDAIVLVCGMDNAVMDSIGQVGTDPGRSWGSGDVTTQDDTLRRACTVTAGDGTPDDAYTTMEWEGFDRDTLDGLGEHCP